MRLLLYFSSFRCEFWTINPAIMISRMYVSRAGMHFLQNPATTLRPSEERKTRAVIYSFVL